MPDFNLQDGFAAVDRASFGYIDSGQLHEFMRGHEMPFESE
jgi:hypothetical protein